MSNEEQGTAQAHTQGPWGGLTRTEFVAVAAKALARRHGFDLITASVHGIKAYTEQAETALDSVVAWEVREAAAALCMWVKHILPEWDSEVQKYLDLTEAAIAKAEGR